MSLEHWYNDSRIHIGTKSSRHEFSYNALPEELKLLVSKHQSCHSVVQMRSLSRFNKSFFDNDELMKDLWEQQGFETRREGRTPTFEDYSEECRKLTEPIDIATSIYAVSPIDRIIVNNFDVPPGTKYALVERRRFNPTEYKVLGLFFKDRKSANVAMRDYQLAYNTLATRAYVNRIRERSLSTLSFDRLNDTLNHLDYVEDYAFNDPDDDPQAVHDEHRRVFDEKYKDYFTAKDCALNTLSEKQRENYFTVSRLIIEFIEEFLEFSGRRHISGDTIFNALLNYSDFM